jgi:hypothetical protein
MFRRRNTAVRCCCLSASIFKGGFQLVGAHSVETSHTVVLPISTLVFFAFQELFVIGLCLRRCLENASIE